MVAAAAAAVVVVVEVVVPTKDIYRHFFSNLLFLIF